MDQLIFSVAAKGLIEGHMNHAVTARVRLRVRGLLLCLTGGVTVASLPCRRRVAEQQQMNAVFW